LEDIPALAGIAPPRTNIVVTVVFIRGVSLFAGLGVAPAAAAEVAIHVNLDHAINTQKE